MAKADFSSYLSIPAESIERPKPLPGGHFLADVKAWKTDERNFAKAGDPPKITPLVTLTFTITSACDDVEDPPEEFGQIVTKDYTLNDPDKRGQWNLRRIAEDFCGVPAKGLNLDDLLDAAIGSGVKLFNEPRAGRGDDADNFYTNITRVLSPND